MDIENILELRSSQVEEKNSWYHCGKRHCWYKRWAVGKDVISHTLKQKPTTWKSPCQKSPWKSFHVSADQKVTELFRWCSRRRTQYDHSMHPPEIQFWALLHDPSRDLIWKCCTHSQLCVLNKDGLKPYTYTESEKNHQDYQKKKN